MSEEKGKYYFDETLPEEVAERYRLEAQGKPIRCPECRLVIGHVVRRSGIRNLRVEVGGFAFELEGAADVWCPCGGLLHWHAGQEAIDELLRNIHRGSPSALPEGVTES